MKHEPMQEIKQLKNPLKKIILLDMITLCDMMRA